MISNLHKQRFQKNIPLVEGALFPIFFIFVFFWNSTRGLLYGNRYYGDKLYNACDIAILSPVKL